MGVKLCTFLLCLIYKSSYVPRSVSVHLMYQNVRTGSFFSVQLNNALFEFLFVMLIRNLTLVSLSRLSLSFVVFFFHFTFIYNKN